MVSDNQPLADNEKEGISRRDFLKFCSTVAIAIGLGPSGGSKVFAALTSASRPTVLWLHFAECTGCTEALLRTINPYIDDLLLDTISLDYHETLMAGAGKTVHDILIETAEKNRGNFICVVEGSIPTKDNGVYGMINGKTMLSIAEEVCPKAKCIIAIGSCASFGGIVAAAPNPTGAKNVIAALKHINLPPVVTVPGCPPNPVSFVGVISYYLLNGKLPPTDAFLRPLFAYEIPVHESCPFIDDIGEGGRCLIEAGCKGPAVHNNCTMVKYNNGTSFPMNAGHICIGCSEPNSWDFFSPFWTDKRIYQYPVIGEEVLLPRDVFEKEVEPIGVIRRPGRKNIKKHSKPDSRIFDLSGRKVPADLSNVNKKPAAGKVLIEKTGNLVKKHLRVK